MLSLLNIVQLPGCMSLEAYCKIKTWFINAHIFIDACFMNVISQKAEERSNSGETLCMAGKKQETEGNDAATDK